MKTKKQQKILDEIRRGQREDAIKRYGQKFLDYEANCNFFNIKEGTLDSNSKNEIFDCEHFILENQVADMFARGEQVPYELKERLLRINRPDLFDENGNPTIDINAVGNPSN